MDEEIESDIDEDVEMVDDSQPKGKRGGALANDPFFMDPNAGEGEVNENETVEERKLRMTK